MITTSNLKKISLLEGLDESELEQLCESLNERSFKKGAHIILAEEQGASMMFIASGKVKISISGNEGKEGVLTHLGAGEFFGEISLLTGEDRSADVIALENCQFYVLTAAEFERHMESNTGLARALLKELALRLTQTSSKLIDLMLLDVYRRVARTLKGLGREITIKEGETTTVVDKRPTHQELASLVGTSREMVTRALKDLEDEGHIRTEGKRIEVVSLPS